jgi:DNA-binding CsgD family transcriptional regulator
VNLKTAAWDTLAPRDVRLAGFIIQGYINPEIQKAMGYTLNTIKSYPKDLYSKLGISLRWRGKEERMKRNRNAVRYSER